MKITSAYERRIRERWEKIEPALIFWIKSHPAVIEHSFEFTMTSLKRIHREVIVDCLELKIPFRHIRRYEIDDPRIPGYERLDRIAQFLESQRRHPGRSPSLGRSSNKRPAAILPGDI